MIADFLGLSKVTIWSLVKALVSKGLVERKEGNRKYLRTTQVWYDQVVVAGHNSPTKTSQEAEKVLEISEDIRSVYQCFLDKFGKTAGRYKLTPKRIGKIKKRLGEFSVEDLLLAIEHAAEDGFYSGSNSRGWTADLDYITRSYEITEKLINLTPNGNRKGVKNIRDQKYTEGKYGKFIRKN
jgi:hypothetical protein